MHNRSALLLLLTLLPPAIATAAPDWQLLRVNGSSMEPAIHHGELLCLHRKVSEFNIGDLVAIRLSDHRPPLLKRIIAVAGDLVEFKGDKIRRNGKIVTETASHRALSALKVQLSRYGNIVPPGNLITLGDNREHSFDSFKYGLVPTSQLLGTVEPNMEGCVTPD